MKTLHLTSPPTHAPNVAHLQSLLKNHGWYHSKIDSIYDIYTAQAVYRAKYWLGYLHPNYSANDALMGYLHNKRKPSMSMKALTKFRMLKKSKPGKSIGEKALLQAQKYVGQKESPAYSNRIPFASLWYGVIGSWCAMAVTRWMVDAGSKAFKRGSRYAYVPFMVDDARAGRNYLTLTHNPQPGDVVAFDWPGESPGVADHTGLFDRWEDRSTGIFWTYEGNTSSDNNSNGGEVMHRKDRYVSEVQCFIHVSK